MALPARVVVPNPRHVARARSHTIEPRKMVKATAHVRIDPAARPVLTVVPRRKRAARFLALVCAVVVAAMLGAAAFQTSLAQRQLEMDRLDQDITNARERYEILRQERAELRSPGRLALVAGTEGMVPAKQSSFVELSPELVATVQESVGQMLDGAATSNDPLDQFRTVKSMNAAP